jgi:hypothetical protein
MQAQFDEYRTMAELLFNVEMAKLEDEIASQATRYELEILYVIQAKDKFYSDMMIAKDAKIMGLIDGSDLQSVMQKHELVKDCHVDPTCIFFFVKRLTTDHRTWRISEKSI